MNEGEGPEGKKGGQIAAALDEIKIQALLTQNGSVRRGDLSLRGGKVSSGRKGGKGKKGRFLPGSGSGETKRKKPPLLI